MGLELHYVEGQTGLDEDEKEGIKITTITTHTELNEYEQLNIEKALEWTITKKISSEKLLSEDFVKSLHKRMFGNVWKWAGEFRRTEKNIGVEWIKIGIELRNLLDDTKFWIENETYPPEEIAIRFKHRLVNIHCFPNGNGRHSRLMADLIIEKIFDKPVFTWGRRNLTAANDMRQSYIRALKRGDNGDIQALIDFART